jgi:hypothetical protein
MGLHREAAAARRRCARLGRCRAGTMGGVTSFAAEHTLADPAFRLGAAEVAGLSPAERELAAAAAAWAATAPGSSAARAAARAAAGRAVATPTAAGHAVAARAGDAWAATAGRRAFPDHMGQGDPYGVAGLRDRIRAGEDPLGEAFFRIRTPRQRRRAGQTFTPGPVVDSMVCWAARALTPARVVDPGAGSARFLAGVHAHFFLATALYAVPGDAGALVTAAEWLDVNYGSLIRALLRGPLGGESVHLLDPAAAVFPDAAATSASPASGREPGLRPSGCARCRRSPASVTSPGDAGPGDGAAGGATLAPAGGAPGAAAPGLPRGHGGTGRTVPGAPGPRDRREQGMDHRGERPGPGAARPGTCSRR